MKLVEDLTPKKPVLKMLVDKGIPYEKWSTNIKTMVADALGVERSEKITVPSTTYPQFTITLTRSELVKMLNDTWEAAIAHVEEIAAYPYGRSGGLQTPDRNTYVTNLITSKQ